MFEHCVSGHGRVGDSTMFYVAQRYLHWLRETAEAGLRRPARSVGTRAWDAGMSLQFFETSCLCLIKL